MKKLNRRVNVPIIVATIVVGTILFFRPPQFAKATDFKFALNANGTAIGFGVGDGNRIYYANPIYAPAPTVVVNPRPYPAPPRYLPPTPPRHYPVPRYLPPPPQRRPLPPPPARPTYPTYPYGRYVPYHNPCYRIDLDDLDDLDDFDDCDNFCDWDD